MADPCVSWECSHMGKTSDLCEHGKGEVKCEERERERERCNLEYNNHKLHKFIGFINFISSYSLIFTKYAFHC
jgi:hypothetical protein